jgi:hypothetical protein
MSMTLERLPPDPKMAGERPTGLGKFRQAVLAVAVIGSFVALALAGVWHVATRGPKERLPDGIPASLVAAASVAVVGGLFAWIRRGPQVVLSIASATAVLAATNCFDLASPPGRGPGPLGVCRGEQVCRRGRGVRAGRYRASRRVFGSVAI